MAVSTLNPSGNISFTGVGSQTSVIRHLRPSVFRRCLHRLLEHETRLVVFRCKRHGILQSPYRRMIVAHVVAELTHPVEDFGLGLRIA